MTEASSKGVMRLKPTMFLTDQPDTTHVNESNNRPGGLHRRDLLKGVAAASLVFATGAFGTPQVAANSPVSSKKGRDMIRRENAKPGTRDWMLTNTYIDPDTWWRSPRIEGYCSEMSVSAGDTLKIMVSTNPVSEFSLEIFRTGYYGGTGGRSMKKFDSIQGKIQPDPPIGENRLRECKWEPSVEFKIPDDWLSGVYLGKLTARNEGLQSYVIFIVRDDRPCDLPGFEILANGTPVNNEGKPKRPHAATIYDGPKGNVVFNAGTIWWAQGLSSPPGHVLPAHKYEKNAKPQGPDPRVQRMMTNVFERFIK